MHIYRTGVNGSPNIGLFGYATDSLLLFGEHLPDKHMESVVESLGNPELHFVRIAGTNMPGLFMVGNSETVLIPGITFKDEKNTLDEIGIKYKVFDTEQTCLGNNIVCNDNGAIISTDFTNEESEKISELLGVPVEQMDIAGLKTPGAFIVLNGKWGIIHRDATDEEIDRIEKLLKVELSPATTNMGTPYLRSAIVNNSHGFVIGEQTSGPEVVHIDECLGYGDEE